MTRITRDDVTRAVGVADDVTIAQIIGTQATVEELAEAQAWLANDEPMMNAGRPLAMAACVSSSISSASCRRTMRTTTVRPRTSNPPIRNKMRNMHPA